MQPCRKWVGDISYLSTEEGWLYLATIIDLFSRKVVGWALGDRMTKQLVIDAMNQALQHERPSKGLIFLTVVPSMPPMITKISYAVTESARA